MCGTLLLVCEERKFMGLCLGLVACGSEMDDGDSKVSEIDHFLSLSSDGRKKTKCGTILKGD